MVRKRSRTSRKYYDSDENDSDSDFALEDPPAGPTQKKYSLRQRKRPLFTEDFDYDDDGEEVAPPKAASDDEDFEIQNELELDEAPESEYIDKTTYINHYEPENSDIPDDAEGLIDFEDMIRADIVVNKNRIDYDNIIQKTEIKVQPIEEIQAQTQPVRSKRGRKPKVRPVEEIDSSLLEPETEVQEEAEYEDKHDKDYNPDDDIEPEEVIDCTKLMQTELKECITDITDNILNLPNDEEVTVNNGNKLSENQGNNTTNPHSGGEQSTAPSHEECHISKESLTIVNEDSPLFDVSPVRVNENSNDTIQINGKISASILANIEEKSADIRECERNKTVENDDDVVLVEDDVKCEVIVLDD